MRSLVWCVCLFLSELIVLVTGVGCTNGPLTDWNLSIKNGFANFSCCGNGTAYPGIFARYPNGSNLNQDQNGIIYDYPPLSLCSRVAIPLVQFNCELQIICEVNQSAVKNVTLNITLQSVDVECPNSNLTLLNVNLCVEATTPTDMQTFTTPGVAPTETTVHDRTSPITSHPPISTTANSSISEQISLHASTVAGIATLVVLVVVVVPAIALAVGIFVYQRSKRRNLKGPTVMEHQQQEHQRLTTCQHDTYTRSIQSDLPGAKPPDDALKDFSQPDPEESPTQAIALYHQCSDPCESLQGSVQVANSGTQLSHKNINITTELPHNRTPSNTSS